MQEASSNVTERVQCTLLHKVLSQFYIYLLLNNILTPWKGKGTLWQHCYLTSDNLTSTSSRQCLQLDIIGIFMSFELLLLWSVQGAWINPEVDSKPSQDISDIRKLFCLCNHPGSMMYQDLDTCKESVVLEVDSINLFLPDTCKVYHSISKE